MDTTSARPGYVKVTLTDGDEEVTHELPARFEVCGRCEGHGTHLNPSIGARAYSQEEFEHEFDEEERQHYFTRGGMYDVPCEARLTAEEKVINARFQEQEEENARYDAEWEAESRMERMMGC